MKSLTSKSTSPQPVNYGAFKQQGGIEGFRDYLSGEGHRQLLVRFDNSLEGSIILNRSFETPMVEIRVRRRDGTPYPTAYATSGTQTRTGSDAISVFSFEDVDANLQGINRLKVSRADKRQGRSAQL